MRSVALAAVNLTPDRALIVSCAAWGIEQLAHLTTVSSSRNLTQRRYGDSELLERDFRRFTNRGNGELNFLPFRRAPASRVRSVPVPLPEKYATPVPRA